MYSRPDVGVVRSFRLPRALDEELRREAEERGVSVNTLVTNIIRKYLEWDRYAEKFGYMSMSTQEYSELVGSLDQQRVKEIAASVGRSMLQEGVLFWFKDQTLENTLNYIKLRCRHSRVAEYELSRQGDTLLLNLHHPYKANHSVYLAETLRAALERATPDPKIHYTDHSITVRIYR